MTEKDLEIQSLRRALKLTEEMYDKQLEENERWQRIKVYTDSSEPGKNSRHTTKKSDTSPEYLPLTM